MGGEFGENGHVYTYGWVPSLFTWGYHNIANQVYLNKKNILDIKNKIKFKFKKREKKEFDAGILKVHTYVCHDGEEPLEHLTYWLYSNEIC